MTMFQLLSILRARWATMLAVFVLAVGATAAASLLLPKQYTAETQVVIDIKPDPVAGIVMPGMLAPGYIATQVDIVTSERLALMVVDRLGIAQDPYAIEQFRQAMDGKGSIRQYYAELLGRSLEVKPSRESSLLTIAFEGADPAFAANVANAFAQAYVDTNIEMKVEPAKQQRVWFEEQTALLRKRLDDAQGRLSEYQQKNQIVSSDERLDVETAKLQELSSQLTAAVAQTVDAQKRHEQAQAMVARGVIQELTDVLQNPLVQQLKVNQATLEARLREQGAVLGAQHPEIIKLNEELRGTRERVREEGLTVAASMARTFTVAQQRENELRRNVEQQRQRVLSLKSGREELNVLQRDVDNAQAAYENVSHRLTQTGLESRSSQANLFILKPALPPNEHSSPKLLLNLAASVLLGVLLAVGTALLLELLNRRIRGASDLAQAVGAPVIGHIRRVPRRLMRDPKNRKLPMRHAAQGNGSIPDVGPDIGLAGKAST